MSLYFAAIEPQPELSQRVKEIQKDFANRFGARKAFDNFPHITIIPPFSHDEKNESEVVGHFQKTHLETSPFLLKLKGFGSFPNKKNPVIYIEPEISQPLKSLYQSMDESMDSFSYVKNFNPHLTIAYRDLTSENFEKAWKEYSSRTFEEDFVVDRVSLYKHYDRKWNLISSKELRKS